MREKEGGEESGKKIKKNRSRRLKIKIKGKEKKKL